MERVKVESSSISEIGYNEVNQILEVKFPRGSIYEYYKVPHKLVFEFMFAESKGKYFHKNIQNVYKFKKVD